jgi:16S rRNA (guanine527-N7)-methyltransferase
VDLSPQSRLQNGTAQLGIQLTAPLTEALFAYLDLIQKWNKVYNLTAVRDPAEMLTHHLLDSLAVINPLRNHLAAMAYAEDGAEAAQSEVQTGAKTEVQRAPQNAQKSEAQSVSIGVAKTGYLFKLLDVGSGAGLPGIVIAICCPDIKVDCVDTVAKKAAFINQVAATLKLPNLRGLHARVENLTEKYQVVSSRAFASLLDFTNLSSQALAQQGIWLAMKGKHPVSEIAALPQSIDVFHVEQLAVPGLDAERCIVWMRRR